MPYADIRSLIAMTSNRMVVHFAIAQEVMNLHTTRGARMSANMLRVRIDRREWQILLSIGDCGPEQVGELLSDIPHRPDLVLIEGPAANRLAEWKALAVSYFGDDADAILIEAPDVTELNIRPLATVMALGRARFLERFQRLANADRSEYSSMAVVAPFDPDGCPPFPEARYLDPFSINPSWRYEAWQNVWTHIGTLTREIHHRGLAVIWPSRPSAGYHDPDFKPWRNVASLSAPVRASVCPLDPDSQVGPFVEDEVTEPLLVHNLQRLYKVAIKGAGPKAGGDSENDDSDDGRELERGLQAPLLLLQRILLALHAVADSSPLSEDCWAICAELLAELGYLSADSGYLTGMPGELKRHFDAGFLLARMHLEGLGHGDLHLDNFGYLPDTERPRIIDSGGTYELRRPEHPAEKASDLSVVRLECDFLQWQSVRLAYKAMTPGTADTVLACGVPQCCTCR